MTRLEWGVVEVIGGPHKGAVAYYDDDENGQAVIYLERPLDGPYELVPYEHIRAASEDARIAWHLKYDHFEGSVH